jgi:hypothetical protein
MAFVVAVLVVWQAASRLTMAALQAILSDVLILFSLSDCLCFLLIADKADVL